MATSSSQSVASRKKLLVLSTSNENLKARYTQQQLQTREQEQEQTKQSEQEQGEQMYSHLHYYCQYDDQQQHKQQLIENSKCGGEQKEFQQHMELSQIELIYRAEGNANLVLALPQFKKVLRLPKIPKQLEQRTQHQRGQPYQKNSQQYEQRQGKVQQQEEMNQQEPNKISSIGQLQDKRDAVGILTMDHYVAYISIIRCLVGNEFVFEADIVAVPNPTDRHWINEHIKPYRPANRLDKEFGGHFGLLLPDATQLPAEFDVLFSNFQCKTQSTTITTATKTSHSSNNSSTDNSYRSNNIFGSDTFAIEIKPKQGWLLPNDIYNLFDIKPELTQTTRTLQPSSLRETKTALKAAVATTMPTATTSEAKALKASTDIEFFTTTQSEPSQTTAPATTATKIATKATTTAQIEATINIPCDTDSRSKTSETPRHDKISHSLYDTVDARCRYCCMQFLKIKQQKINKRSQYCPIDLFSGSPERMIFALESLFESPQNNLRIFQNGSLVFDDQISRTTKIDYLFSSDKLQLIKHLLVTCLLREYDNKEEAKNEGKEQINKDTKQQLLSSTASITDVGGDGGGNVGTAAGQPQSSVTSCIKQKLNTMPKTPTTTTETTLTETEVTKVKSTLTSAEPIFSKDNILTSTPDYGNRCLEQINTAEVTCLPKNCVLQKILCLQLLAKINLRFMLDHEYAGMGEKTYNIVCKLLEKFDKTHNELTVCQLSPEEQYILGATALDCSIMITFCEIENVLRDKTQTTERSSTDNAFEVSVFGKKFLTKVTLLDLDPKTDAHFNKYFLQTRQILDAMKEL